MMRIVLIQILLLISITDYAQNMHIPQLQEMNIWYNPALKTNKIAQTYISFRNVNYPGIISYSSKAIAIDIPLTSKDKEITDIAPYANITAGINSSSSTDRAMAASAAMIAISYSVPLSGDETYLSAGFNANYNFNRIGQGLIGYYPDEFDKKDALGAAIAADPFLSGYNFGYFTAGAGAAIFHNGENDQWYIGASTSNFNHPYTEWDRISRLAANNGVQLGYTTTIGSAAGIGGYANLSWHGGIFEHFFGANYIRRLGDSANYKIAAGVGYKVDDALVPNLVFSTRRSRFSFFYDINLPGTSYSRFQRKAYAFSYSLIL